MLFHLEVDDKLMDVWLAEPTMATQAQAALGNDYQEQLRSGLAVLRPTLARAVFDEFATHCMAPRAAALTGGTP
jgi:hypothetical protein